MNARVEKDLCIGCGLCPTICPDVFEMDDDGKATAFENPVPNGVEGAAKEAADSCPTSAIEVRS